MITFETITNVRWAENKEELQKLPDDFYESVKELILTQKNYDIVMDAFKDAPQSIELSLCNNR